jgi:hypothetical protein
MPFAVPADIEKSLELLENLNEQANALFKPREKLLTDLKNDEAELSTAEEQIARHNAVFEPLKEISDSINVFVKSTKKDIENALKKAEAKGPAEREACIKGEWYKERKNTLEEIGDHWAAVNYILQDVEYCIKDLTAKSAKLKKLESKKVEPEPEPEPQVPAPKELEKKKSEVEKEPAPQVGPPKADKRQVQNVPKAPKAPKAPTVVGASASRVQDMQVSMPSPVSNPAQQLVQMQNPMQDQTHNPGQSQVQNPMQGQMQYPVQSQIQHPMQYSMQDFVPGSMPNQIQNYTPSPMHSMMKYPMQHPQPQTPRDASYKLSNSSSSPSSREQQLEETIEDLRAIIEDLKHAKTKYKEKYREQKALTVEAERKVQQHENMDQQQILQKMKANQQQVLGALREGFAGVTIELLRSK